jgi:hypothetical protein
VSSGVHGQKCTDFVLLFGIFFLAPAEIKKDVVLLVVVDFQDQKDVAFMV